jgi:hypothetical protein
LNGLRDGKGQVHSEQISSAPSATAATGVPPATSQATSTPGVASMLVSSRRHRMPPPVPRSVVHFGQALLQPLLHLWPHSARTAVLERASMCELFGADSLCQSEERAFAVFE